MKNLCLFSIFLFYSVIILAQNNTNYPGNDVIGRGYDVFGEYANKSSIKDYPILDFTKCTTKNEGKYVIPSIILLKFDPTKDIKDVSGSSINDYSKSLAQSVNLKANAFFFAGSANSNFNYNSLQTEKRYYQTKMDRNLQWKISLDTRPDTLALAKYLDETFKKELLTKSPEYIFENYGTHIIVQALLGGRIDFSYSEKITGNTTQSDVESVLSGRYGILKGGYSNSNGQGINSSLTNKEVKLKVIGGETLYINEDLSSEQYNTWAAGIPNNSTLCDFTNNSLIPIWSIVTDKNIRKKLSDYYNNVLLINNHMPSAPEIKKLSLVVDEVYIKNSCENYFKKYGEFQLLFFINGKQVSQSQESKGTEGQDCYFDKMSFTFDAPTKEGEFVNIELRVIENDTPARDELTMGVNGKIIYNIKYPLSDELYKKGYNELFKEDPVAGKYCEANVTYHLQVAD
ncbi:MAG: hypothetical protein A2033_09015 [Bacteroidetes bacterium GWA2_31_9]|nr:MAG: hypothetical protein A2033_09015 [Bacteroidetes bacterium GWA2_31_9]